MNLRELYDTLDQDQRAALAARAGIKPPYLWQIATQWSGRKPSLEVLKKLADADKRLSVSELVSEFTVEAPAPDNGMRRRSTDKKLT